MDDILPHQNKYTKLPKELVDFVTMVQKDRRIFRSPMLWRLDSSPLQADWLIAKRAGQSESDILQDKITKSLNKLSERNYDDISKEILSISIKNEVELQQMAQIILITSIKEYTYSNLYAKLCGDLINCVVEIDDVTYYFRKFYFEEFQKQFDSYMERDSIYNKDEEIFFKDKNLWKGLLVLLGELYKHEIVPWGLVQKCLDNFITDKFISHFVEGFQILSMTISIVMTHDQKAYVKENAEMILKKKPPNRIKFMLMDLIELM